MSAKLRKLYKADSRVDSFFTKKQIQISEDGEYIFCPNENGITIVEFNSGAAIHTIEITDEQVTSLSVSPNNKVLAVGLQSSSVKQYDITGLPGTVPKIISSFKSYHTHPILSLCWDESSVLLATGCAGGSTRVWDLKQKFCTHSMKDGQGSIRKVLFYPDLHKKPWLFVACYQNLLVWRLEEGSSYLLARMEGHSSAIIDFQLSESNEQLISCGLDKVIMMWNLKTFSVLKNIPLFETLSGVIIKPPHISMPNAPLMSDHNIVFTIGSKNTPRVWDVNRATELWRAETQVALPAEKSDISLSINQVLYVKAKNCIALTTYDHNILFLECDTMKICKQLVGFNEQIFDVLFVGEKNEYTAVASNSYEVRVYDNKTKSCQLLSGHTNIVMCLARHFTKPRIFASASRDGTARIWMLPECEEKSEIKEKEIDDKDGVKNETEKMDEDNKDDVKIDETSAVVKSTCLKGIRCLAMAKGHTQAVGCVVMGSISFFTGSKDTCIKLWDFNLGELVNSSSAVELVSKKTEHAHDVDISAMALSKNFGFLATGSIDRTIKLWNASTMVLVAVMKGHKKGVWSVKFSPVDRLLASASSDFTIKIWALNNFSNVATFQGHDSGVLSLCWLNKGLQIMSSSSDGLIKVWSTRTGLCLETIEAHENRIWALDESDEGATVVSGGEDASVVWWKDITKEKEQEEIEEKNKTAHDEQILNNLIRKRMWANALKYCLRNRHPLRALMVLKRLLDERPQDLNRALRSLKADDRSALLEFAVEWNTKTKNVREAQVILNYFLKEYLPEELEELAEWSKTVEGFLPYTEKHMKRVTALSQSSAIINYAVCAISIAGLTMDTNTDTMQSLTDDVVSLSNGTNDVEMSEVKIDLYDLADIKVFETDEVNLLKQIGPVDCPVVRSLLAVKEEPKEKEAGDKDENAFDDIEGLDTDYELSDDDDEDMSDDVSAVLEGSRNSARAKFDLEQGKGVKPKQETVISSQ